MRDAKRDKAGATKAESVGATAEPISQAALALFFLTAAFVVYAPALFAGFIWDDGRAITDNVALRSLGGLGDLWAGRGDADYLPLKSTVLWIVYQLFGAKTAPYHVLNVVVHAANAVLLAQVLRRLTIPGAWLAALIFLVHPTHVESVAWVSECKNTLSTMFALLSVLAWLRHREDGRPRSYLVSLLLFVCALLCKGHVVVLPAVLVLLDWWRKREPPLPAEVAESRFLVATNAVLAALVLVAAAASRDYPAVGIACAITGLVGLAAAPLAKRLGLPRIPRTLAFFQLAMLFGAVTVWFQFGHAIRDYQLPAGALPSRVANAGKAAWWYLEKSLSPTIVWYEMPDRPIEIEPEAQAFLAGKRPANAAPALPLGTLTQKPLCMIYPRWRVTPPVWYDFVPAAAMVGLLLALARRRHGYARAPFVALIYFLLTLAPVLGVVKLSYMRAAWVADHFQYLADIGIIALACAAASLRWQRAGQVGRRALAGVGATVVAVFAVSSFVRALDYRSELTMWTDTVAKNPGAVQAHGRLGAALLAKRDPQKAAAHFAEAIRLKPDVPDEHNNYGLALTMLGRVDEGIEQYRESLRLDGAQLFAHANLGDALASQKRFAEAATEYRSALRGNPELAPLWFRLGTTLEQTGQLDDAIASFERAGVLAPGNPEVAAALHRLRSR